MKTRPYFPHSTARGQSLVEFAISLTFMLNLLSGAVYFGIGLFYYIAMRDAAQEGALFGAMNPTFSGICPHPLTPSSPEICKRVANASGPGLIRNLYDADELDVTVTFQNDTACWNGAAYEGNGITVTLEHEYTLSWLPIGAFIEPFIGQNFIRLGAAVTDTILTPPCPPPP